MSVTYLLWTAMAVYAVVMFVLSPRAKTFGEFFEARESDGQEISLGFLIGSVVISWLFAKSITNAANLGAKYGLVGSVAYAAWYFSIPVAGVVIYRIRKTTAATSLVDFITGKYGKLASLGFSVAILIRLFNEVWSNTAVVAAYFGAKGTTGYLLAGGAFAAATLAYSWRGGLRSSVLTDAIQFGLAVFLLVVVLALVVPTSGTVELVTSGEWKLRAGIDLLLVGLLQSFSYPFHDPVLTDRGFITNAKSTLRGYLIAGAIAGAFIVLFGLLGVHAQVTGLEGGQDAPLRVAQTFGVAVLAGMTVLMMLSAGSTLDSTLSAFAKAFVQDLGGVTPAGKAATTPLPRLAEWMRQRDPLTVGRVTMVVTVIVGSLPLLEGAEILQATTVSGTMVLGLAPVFLLHGVDAAKKTAFHLSFWPGVGLGLAHVAGWAPAWLEFGAGDYAGLLGINVFATAIVFGGFAVGTGVDWLAGGSDDAATAA
ncbi:MAG: sodium:solute symporter [Myxococcota bacterium]